MVTNPLLLLLRTAASAYMKQQQYLQDNRSGESAIALDERVSIAIQLLVRPSRSRMDHSEGVVYRLGL